MLNRKIDSYLREYLKSDMSQILIVEGARQVGKSYSIREAGKAIYPHFVEVNFAEDDRDKGLFRNVHSTEDFYLALSAYTTEELDTRENTLVFLDEIQHYPQFLTLLKFLREEGRYRYIASGSMLGIALRKTISIPVGSIIIKDMYQLDFEEFLWANGVGQLVIDTMRQSFRERQSLSEAIHNRILDLFKKYLLVGGMPDAVNAYLETHNLVRVRAIQNEIRQLYAEDAAKYEKQAGRNLLIRRIYDMVPSQMENKKKRMVIKDINGKKGGRFDRYIEEFEYLISSNVTNAVHAISNPLFPLCESLHKNLLKLYMSDVGMLTAVLYQNNLQPIMNDERSVNLGGVYETVVAQELVAHGHKMFYFDNRKKGEVDFLVDDYTITSVLPIEVKSGRDYTIHSALNNLVSTPDYQIKQAFVLSNDREVWAKGQIVYLPIYYIMFIDKYSVPNQSSVYF